MIMDLGLRNIGKCPGNTPIYRNKNDVITYN